MFSKEEIRLMRSVYKALSHLGWERPGVILNLHWEQIEKILNELGWKLHIDDTTQPMFYVVIYTKDFVKRVTTAFADSRQEAVMKAVVKLGENK